MNRLALAADLTLPPEAVTETFAILANRGAGKSSTVHLLVEQLHHAGSPVIVVDVKGDWWGIRSSADGRQPGLPLVIFGGEHGDVDLGESVTGDLIADIITEHHISAVLDLSEMSKTKARTFATLFAEQLYRRNRDPLHVVVEEADVLIPQRATAAVARLIGAWEDLAKRGRHRGIGMTVVSQRPQEVSKSVLDLMETVVFLRMTGPRSIKAAQDWISVNATAEDPTSAEVITSLPTLDTGEGWVWSPAFLHTLRRVRFLKFNTFDSHVTPTPGRRRVLPRNRADIDLAKIRADITDRNTISEHSAPHHEPQRSAVVATLREQLADRDATIAALRQRIADLETRPELPPGLANTLTTARSHLNDALAQIAAHPPTSIPSRPDPKQPHHPPPPAVRPPTDPRFRAGAERMVMALGRMAPLRLSRTQWGTAAKMKPNSGTFATYLSELRAAGLIDQNTAGFTLTPEGFAHIGGTPPPMTADELQRHYLTVLRRGAARMLQNLIDAYPDGIDRQHLAESSGLSSTSGTFATYLSDLRRNGLIETHGATIIAATVIVHGPGDPVTVKRS
jgi:hypothetical protein